MNILCEISVLFNRKLKETIRQPVWVVTGLMTPLLYTVLFSPLLKGLMEPPRSIAEVLNFFVPAVLTLLAFGTGTGAGYTIIWEWESGVIERLRVTPASRLHAVA